MNVKKLEFKIKIEDEENTWAVCKSLVINK